MSGQLATWMTPDSIQTVTVTPQLADANGNLTDQTDAPIISTVVSVDYEATTQTKDMSPSSTRFEDHVPVSENFEMTLVENILDATGTTNPTSQLARVAYTYGLFKFTFTRGGQSLILYGTRSSFRENHPDKQTHTATLTIRRRNVSGVTNPSYSG